jgi:hypothetical protein
MIPPRQSVKHYASARRRFLQPSIQRFLQSQCPKLLGPLLVERLAEKLAELVERQLPPKDHLRPGQMLWNAVSCRTRPDSPRLELVPVILTRSRLPMWNSWPKEFACRRLLKRRRSHYSRSPATGALLTMRDIGLFTSASNSQLSMIRQQWEKQNATVLPHPGSLQDFGSCISHKALIVRKALAEGKDPRTVAFETQHCQKAVDRYLKDFHRVRTCYQHNPCTDFISQVTGMAPFLVKEYVTILNELEAPNHA